MERLTHENSCLGDEHYLTNFRVTFGLSFVFG